jgi:hypothetical protein
MRFPYGELTSEWPEGFVPPECWPEYGNLADPAGLCRREEVGERPKGIRWALGPLVFEEYVSDQEPDLAASRQGALARPRLVMWHRVRSLVQPPGWHSLSVRPWRVDGVLELTPGVDYTAEWNKKARRDLRRWKEEFASTYSIVHLTREEYATAYKKSLIAKRVNLDRLYQLERRYNTAAADHIELYGMRSPDGAIVAGTAVIYSPTCRASTHFAPFILEEGRSIFAATALMDHWFAETARHGYRFVTTTNFWHPGQPRGWKGFSEFKSHFGFSFVQHPPTLFKLMGGKLF